jgi:hypothetical protein
VFDWITPQFHPAGTAVAALVLLLVLVVAPPLSRRGIARLARRRPTDPGALTAYYLRRTAASVAVGLLVLAVPLVDPGVRPADLGLSLPHGWRAVVSAGLVVYAIVVVVLRTARRHRRGEEGRPARPPLAAIAAITPVTPTEWRWAAAISVVGTTADELALRGLLLAAGIGVLGLDPVAAAMVVLLLGVVGPAVRSARLVVGAVVLGVLTTLTYGLTGSLLVAVLLRVVVGLSTIVAPARPAAAPVH